MVLILHDVGYEQHEEDDPNWIDRAWHTVEGWLSDALWGMADGAGPFRSRFQMPDSGLRRRG